MNALTYEMKRSLRELDLGLKGELTITSDMEDLSNSLFFDQVSPMIFSNFVFMSQSCQQVPPSWAKLAYASLNGLSAWYDHFYTKLIDLKASCSR